MGNLERLSQIETLWSIVQRAHESDEEISRIAQHELLEQYGNAIQRYLRARLRDPAVADDVYQDFAIKFVRGDFQKASPEFGRFRTFLRTVLFRQVADYYRKKKRRGDVQLNVELIEPAAEDDETCKREFAQVWRDEMLKKAWDSLYDLEASSGKPWYSVLQLRVQNPQMGSADLARSMTEQLDKPISSANVRVMLHRAREKFSMLLIETISNSLNTTSVDEIEEELADLQLLEYCQAALDHFRQQSK
ncbi:MAG: RNA polymerase sigma factor [Mariniblastus sp.]